MNKEEAVKVYGKERCQEIHEYLSKLNSYYSFPYNDITLFGLLEDLKHYNSEDLSQSLKSLEERTENFPLKFNEIKKACREAKSLRIKREKLKEQIEDKTIKSKPNLEKLDEIVNSLKGKFTSDRIPGEFVKDENAKRK